MLEASNGTQDIYIARYDANAKLLYASRFGGKETANIYDLAIDANGFALLGGEFQNDFPVNSSQTFDSQGSYDALLLNVGSLGNGYWGYAMGETGRQTVYGVDIDANGDILFAGTFSGTIDLGQGPIMGGNGDLFIAKFAP